MVNADRLAMLERQSYDGRFNSGSWWKSAVTDVAVVVIGLSANDHSFIQSLKMVGRVAMLDKLVFNLARYVTVQRHHHWSWGGWGPGETSQLWKSYGLSWLSSVTSSGHCLFGVQLIVSFVSPKFISNTDILGSTTYKAHHSTNDWPECLIFLPWHISIYFHINFIKQHFQERDGYIYAVFFSRFNLNWSYWIKIWCVVTFITQNALAVVSVLVGPERKNTFENDKSTFDMFFVCLFVLFFFVFLLFIFIILLQWQNQLKWTFHSEKLFHFSSATLTCFLFVCLFCSFLYFYYLFLLFYCNGKISWNELFIQKSFSTFPQQHFNNYEFT